MPLVSICIPAYHAEKYLAETLESVRGQTFAEWELIVVEDGSKDGTEALVNAFAQSVPQPVRYLRHEVNQGLPATRNTGIAASWGDFIALLDSDDCWLPEHLEIAVAKMCETGADLVHSGSILFESATGRELEIRAPSPAAIERVPLSFFLGEYLIQPSSVLLRKSLWERAGGFDPAFRHVEDAEMWMRCARSGGRFLYTGRNTCRYRKHNAALSAQSAEMALASARALQKQIDWEAIPKTVRRNVISGAWMAAARILRRGKPRLAAECAWQAWQANPRPRLLAWACALRLYQWLTRR